MRRTRHDQQLRRYHDRNVSETSFKVGDLVLRRIHNTDDMHKLSAPWEGPFNVTEVISPSTYRSSGATGKEYPTPGTWSIYDDSIHRIVLNLSSVFPFLLPFLDYINKYFKQSSAMSRALHPPPHTINSPPRHARGLS
jgi:hypothetical protein